MTELGLDFLDDLLQQEDTPTKPKTRTKAGIPKPRPIQLGALRYVEKDERCTSRGCGSPTRVRVGTVAYCTTHALYRLNEMILDMVDPEAYADCNCKAGQLTKHNVHTEGCPVYEREKSSERNQR